MYTSRLSEKFDRTRFSRACCTSLLDMMASTVLGQKSSPSSKISACLAANASRTLRDRSMGADRSFTTPTTSRSSVPSGTPDRARDDAAPKTAIDRVHDAATTARRISRRLPGRDRLASDHLSGLPQNLNIEVKEASQIARKAIN